MTSTMGTRLRWDSGIQLSKEWTELPTSMSYHHKKLCEELAMECDLSLSLAHHFLHSTEFCYFIARERLKKYKVSHGMIHERLCCVCLAYHGPLKPQKTIFNTGSKIIPSNFLPAEIDGIVNASSLILIMSKNQI
jgi:hypothetical protein